MSALFTLLTVAGVLAGCASSATTSPSAPPTHTSAATTSTGSNLTVQCTETLTGQDVTGGGVSGTGHCALTGQLHDSGPTTDYRTQNGATVLIRRVVTGANGTITFVITINTNNGGPAPWTITSGTETYANLHGHGFQVVDNYQDSPATFVLKGTVAQNPS